MKQKNHGGIRKGAGRKPLDDKKVTLTIYPRESMVELLTQDRAKEIAISAIEKEYKRYLKKS